MGNWLIAFEAIVWLMALSNHLNPSSELAALSKQDK